jgi:hypothetical protein
VDTLATSSQLGWCRYGQSAICRLSGLENNQSWKADIAMDTPPIVSPQEWESARQELLVKEKELTRAGHAMAALRRRMPWVPVDKDYEFLGPEGTAQSCAAVSLLNCR